MMIAVGIVVFILLVVFLIGYLNFQSERNNYFEKYKVIDEGLGLIRNGDYDGGISKCNEFDYQTHNLCYAVVLQLKKANNETIEKDFCDTIPTKFESNRPFTLDFFRFFESPNEADVFEKSSLKLVEECNQASSST